MTALVVKGKIVPMTQGASTEPFAGSVWIRDDRIEAVTRGNETRPGFDDAAVVDVGDALVLPGFMDMHNHLAYNALPLWAEPGRAEPWLHNKNWPDADTYTERITEPAWTFAKAAPEAILGYVQLRLMIGGATSAQGWPTANRGYQTVVRNVDNERGEAVVDEAFFTSVVTKTDDQLHTRVMQMQAGSGFIYHCAEGRRGSRVIKDFTDLSAQKGLLPTFIGIHCCAVDTDDWKLWDPNESGGVVWSPLSNLVLYNETTLVPAARAQKILICLGSDWGPSGTKNLLGEMKAARVASDHFDYGLTDGEIVEMVTSNPGTLLERVWRRPVGRLAEGGFADVVILRPHTNGSVWSQIVDAIETDIALVVIGGHAHYGDVDLVTAAGGAANSFPLTVAGRKRLAALPDPADSTKPWSWKAIKGELDAIQKDPQKAIEHASGRAVGSSRFADDADLELFLDMPDSRRTGRAGPPKDPSKVRIDKVPSLVHDKAFFELLESNPIHQQTLDRLRSWWTS